LNDIPHRPEGGEKEKDTLKMKERGETNIA